MQASGCGRRTAMKASELVHFNMLPCPSGVPPLPPPPLSTRSTTPAPHPTYLAPCSGCVLQHKVKGSPVSAQVGDNRTYALAQVRCSRLDIARMGRGTVLRSRHTTHTRTHARAHPAGSST